MLGALETFVSRIRFVGYDGLRGSSSSACCGVESWEMELRYHENGNDE